MAAGTNSASVRCDDVDILAHPGMLTTDDAKLAADRGVFLEVTSRRGHNRTNAHVVSIAKNAGADLVINTDAHGPGDLIDAQTARTVGAGAGMTQTEISRAQEASAEFIRKIHG